MAELMPLLQDHMVASGDFRTLAALACTERAAAFLAKPLLHPLRPRWFLSFYGAAGSLCDHVVPEDYANRRPACRLTCNVRLELLPGGFAVVAEEALEYRDEETVARESLSFPFQINFSCSAPQSSH